MLKNAVSRSTVTNCHTFLHQLISESFMKSRLTSQNLRMLGLIAGVAMLSACQSTITRMNDCKSGDWQMIGRKDGEAGLTAQFDDRRDFCAKVDSSKVTAESGTLYLGGWTSGNQQFWYRLGRDDGNRALPVSQFAQQLKSEKSSKIKHPAGTLLR
jgi:hypothetical protein